MTFLPELKRLMDAATKGPWFKRYCDDDNHMCMTVISSKDYGPANTGQFKDEPDTIAATFHQITPVIGDTPDCNEATTDLIIYLVNHAPALAEVVEAAEKVLIGGNHLACLIGNHPPYGTAPEIVRKHYLPHHQDMYEAWCCWNEIMLFREALAKLNANDVNDANDGGKHEG